MSVNILMPALSPTMTEGKLAKWLVKEGDTISAGAVIAEIETDKATMEVEAVDEGIIGKILIPAGTDNVQVNSIIAILVGEGEDVAALSNSTPSNSNVTKSSSSCVDIPCVPVSSSGGNYGGGASGLQDPEIPAGTVFASQTVREALRDAMAEEMRRDDDVYLMGEEVAEYQGAYKISQGLLEEFGARRVIDTPITEHGFAGLAVGSAFTGLKPIVEFMTFNFAMQAMDHIINSAAKTLYMAGGQLGCPIVFRGPNGAAARVGAQHSQDYSSWYAHIPGLKVVAPYSADDAKGLMKAAIRDPNPVIFLENEIMYGRSFDVPVLDDYVLPIGKARIRREGKDVTLVSYSISVGYALEAAEKLAAEGIQAEVIDLRSLRPLDYDTVVRSVMKTNRCVTVEEGWPVCSIGSEIASYLMENAFDYLDAPVLKVTGKDVPMPYAANLEKLALPHVDDVISAVKKVCYR
jgi:pyruvate dehydrogenase E1 component beta subunit